MRWEEVCGLGCRARQRLWLFPKKNCVFFSAKGSETSHLWWENSNCSTFRAVFHWFMGMDQPRRDETCQLMQISPANLWDWFCWFWSGVIFAWKYVIKNYSCFSYEPDDPVIADAWWAYGLSSFQPSSSSKSFPYVKKQWISEIRLFPELFHKLLVISILED